MTCTADIPVATLARDLPTELQHAAWEGIAGLAWANNVLIVFAGQRADGAMVLCDGCPKCPERPGSVVVVPDTEAVSMWGPSRPGGALTLQGPGGRIAYVFAGTGPRR